MARLVAPGAAEKIGRKRQGGNLATVAGGARGFSAKGRAVVVRPVARYGARGFRQWGNDGNSGAGRRRRHDSGSEALFVVRGRAGSGMISSLYPDILSYAWRKTDARRSAQRNEPGCWQRTSFIFEY
jgi:hypothetical protein